MKNRSFTLTIFLLLSVCLPPAAVSADGDSDGRPGATNPVTTSRQILFRDDELMLFMGRPGVHKMDYLYAVPGDDDLSGWQVQNDEHTYLDSEFGALHDGDLRPIASARGRTGDHEHDYAVYAFFRPEAGNYDVTVEQYDPVHGRKSKWNHFWGSKSNYRSVDIALGDLDGLSDENGWYHDEIVLVRSATHESNEYAQVDVIGHDDALTSLDYDVIRYSDPYHVAVDIGDLDGDGTLEFIVGVLRGQGNYWLEVYSFSNTNDDGPKLVKHSRYTRWTDYGDGFDLTVGDFDGDGKAEVFVATGQAGNNIDLFQADDDLILHHKFNQISGLNGKSNTLRVVSGLFRFDADPAKEWTLNRRQLAVCYQYGDNCGTCTLYTVSSKTKIDTTIGAYDWCVTESDWGDSCTPNQYNPCPTYGIASLDIAAGNFVGHGTDEKQTSPLMDLAISSVETKAESYVTAKLRPAMRVLSIRSGSLEDKWHWAGIQYDYDNEQGSWQLATTVSAADGDGDTYRLGGSPAHIVIEHVLRADRIIQEPPKHVDYLPTNYNDVEKDWMWDVINVSGHDEFAVSLHDESTTILETETTSTSDWATGGTVELDVKASVSVGDMDVEGIEVGVEVDTKLGYDYEESKSSYTSQYHARTYVQDVSTNKDDVLQTLFHPIDVWRYPILGYYEKDSDKPYGYQEIVMPAPYTEIDKGSGKDHPDWYQPFHENHNILSYPFYEQGAGWTPDDQGSFTIPDPDNPDNPPITIDDTMNARELLHWNGNHFSQEMTWTSTAGAGSEKSYENTLSESEELTISFNSKATILIGSVDEKFTGKVGFHNSNSWGGKTVSNATNSKTTGIHIEIPSESLPSPSAGYEFTPAVYATSTGGTLKVAFAVGIPQGDWWLGQYGRKPDPALNLPNRLKSAGDDSWILNEDDSRHQMRGFFLREYSDNAPDPKARLISRSIVDGDIVQLCARVYNYSLSLNNPTGNFLVKFSYYPWDMDAGEQVGPLVSQPLMSVTANLDALTKIDGTSRKEFCVNWDTSGLSAEEVNTYRFQVMLDEDGDVDEIHELYDKKGNEVPGSNNIGTYPWTGATVVCVSPTDCGGQSSQRAQILAVVDHDQNDLSIVAGSMAVKTEQGIIGTDDRGGPLHLELGKTYEIRAQVEADQHHPFFRWVLLYDGPPDGKDKGKRTGHPAGKGKVIGSSRLYGIQAGSQYTWLRWTPDTLGKQEIWMRLLEDADEVNPGNAVDSLDVIVVPAKKSKQESKKSK